MKLKWHSNHNAIIYFEDNDFENVVWKTLSRLQCVNQGVHIVIAFLSGLCYNISHLWHKGYYVLVY